MYVISKFLEKLLIRLCHVLYKGLAYLLAWCLGNWFFKTCSYQSFLNVILWLSLRYRNAAGVYIYLKLLPCCSLAHQHTNQLLSRWYLFAVFVLLKSLHLYCENVWVFVFTYAGAHVWRSEESFQELVLSFYNAVSKDWPQGIRLDSRCLYLISHLTGPKFKDFLKLL